MEIYGYKWILVKSEKFLQTLRRSMERNKIHTKMRFAVIERVNLYFQFAFLLSAVRFFFTELKNDHFCFVRSVTR